MCQDSAFCERFQLHSEVRTNLFAFVFRFYEESSFLSSWSRLLPLLQAPRLFKAGQQSKAPNVSGFRAWISRRINRKCWSSEHGVPLILLMDTWYLLVRKMIFSKKKYFDNLTRAFVLARTVESHMNKMGDAVQMEQKRFNCGWWKFSCPVDGDIPSSIKRRWRLRKKLRVSFHGNLLKILF